VGPNHLSRIESWKLDGSLDDPLLDANLFCIESIPNYLEEIALFLTMGVALTKYSTTQKRYLVARASNYRLISGQLHKIGSNNIL
jgi:hypothetical protein